MKHYVIGEDFISDYDRGNENKNFDRIEKNPGLQM